MIGWVGLGWVGLGWVGLGWIWIGFDMIGLNLIFFGWIEQFELILLLYGENNEIC